MSEKWPIGVFASIDAGLGVKLDVARDLGVHTVHLHTPHAGTRTPQRAAEFNKRLADFGIKITCVFAGFEGESYADIPTVKRTVGLMPRETRAARTTELKSIADFARDIRGRIYRAARTPNGCRRRRPSARGRNRRSISARSSGQPGFRGA